MRLPHPRSDIADIVTLSAGVAELHGAGRDAIETWLRRAEQALEAARAVGRRPRSSAGPTPASPANEAARVIGPRPPVAARRQRPRPARSRSPCCCVVLVARRGRDPVHGDADGRDQREHALGSDASTAGALRAGPATSRASSRRRLRLLQGGPEPSAETDRGPRRPPGARRAPSRAADRRRRDPGPARISRAPCASSTSPSGRCAPTRRRSSGRAVVQDAIAYELANVADRATRVRAEVDGPDDAASNGRSRPRRAGGRRRDRLVVAGLVLPDRVGRRGPAHGPPAAPRSATRACARSTSATARSRPRPDGILITDATRPGHPVAFVNPAFTPPDRLDARPSCSAGRTRCLAGRSARASRRRRGPWTWRRPRRDGSPVLVPRQRRRDPRRDRAASPTSRGPSRTSARAWRRRRRSDAARSSTGC